jgi:hypothetical protein
VPVKFLLTIGAIPKNNLPEMEIRQMLFHRSTVAFSGKKGWHHGYLFIFATVLEQSNPG